MQNSRKRQASATIRKHDFLRPAGPFCDSDSELRESNFKCGQISVIQWSGLGRKSTLLTETVEVKHTAKVLIRANIVLCFGYFAVKEDDFFVIIKSVGHEIHTLLLYFSTSCKSQDTRWVEPGVKVNSEYISMRRFLSKRLITSKIKLAIKLAIKLKA